jgi:ATP-dependent DNA helicase RecQ
MTELERLARLAPDWSWSKIAVIAREWKFLDPVRAYCELHGIPAQTANDEAPNFWRLRETQALRDWLRDSESKLVSAAAVSGWLAQHAQNRWLALLQEGTGEYAAETGGAEMPKDHFVEWLAEWGREARRRQTGLLLLTAHRAKGLEFDHVVVLDGNWDHVSRGEDEDAPRRLFYVAMTRAKHTLTLARMARRHTLLDALPESEALQLRAGIDLPAPPRELQRRYERLGLGDVDLGFAGRHDANKPVHRAIAALTVEDPLLLESDGGRWALVDTKGTTVGRLASGYRPPEGMKCVSATVFAVVNWRRDDTRPEYRDIVRCESWAVLVPELVFVPG